MTNKYETGRFHLHLFDKHGTKLETLMKDNLTQAQADGEERIKAPPAASYVVTRILFNSIDRSYPWNVPPGQLVEVNDE
jgi:hypothetical protein